MNRCTRLFRRLVMLTALVLPAVATTFASDEAHASVSIAVQFDELVERSKAVAVTTPVEQRSVWEGRYIITYTKLNVDDAIAGGVENGKEVWVATRGGTVGDIGQHVEGEPVFRVGKPVLVFLREDIIDNGGVPASGLFIVTARAQGLFPVIKEADKRAKIVQSTHTGMLLPPKAKIPVALKALAREVLDDKDVDDARATIAAAWRRIHDAKNSAVKKPQK